MSYTVFQNLIDSKYWVSRCDIHPKSSVRVADPNGVAVSQSSASSIFSYGEATDPYDRVIGGGGDNKRPGGEAFEMREREKDAYRQALRGNTNAAFPTTTSTSSSSTLRAPSPTTTAQIHHPPLSEQT